MKTNIEAIKKQQYIISVIIAFYNNASKPLALKLLDKLYQLPDNIEIICIDDGSTDDTLEILSKYSDRFKIVSTENQGVFLAYTEGFKMASGFYLHGLDADDEFDTDFYLDSIKLVEQGIAPDVFAAPRYFFYCKKKGIRKKFIKLRVPKGLTYITKKNFHKIFVPASPNKIDGYRWNKLLKASYLKNIMDAFKADTYEKKIIWSEDNLHTYPVYMQSKHIYVFDKSYYNYYWYNGSTSKGLNYYYAFVYEHEYFFEIFNRLFKYFNYDNRIVGLYHNYSILATYYSLWNVKHKKGLEELRNSPSFKPFFKFLLKYNFIYYIVIKCKMHFLFNLRKLFSA